MTDATFAPIPPADPALLEALHRDAYHGGYADWDAAFFGKLLALPTTRGRLAIDAGGTPLGFVLWQQTEDNGEVITLAVRANAQRQGWGRQLLGMYEEQLAGGGVWRSILDVAEDNVPARALYTALGYTEINRRGGYYRHYDHGRETRVDALVLEKTLA